MAAWCASRTSQLRLGEYPVNPVIIKRISKAKMLGGSSKANVQSAARQLVQLHHQRVQERGQVDRLSRTRGTFNNDLACSTPCLTAVKKHAQGNICVFTEETRARRLQKFQVIISVVLPLPLLAVRVPSVCAARFLHAGPQVMTQELVAQQSSEPGS